LSKSFGESVPLETSCGTPEYVAPEVITAEGSYDKQVDMWSIGVITYVLLCGFSPFSSKTQTGLFQKITNVEYSFPNPEWAGITQTAKDFIRQLLVKNPKLRMTPSQCLEHSWLNGDQGQSSLTDIRSKMNEYNERRKNWTPTDGNGK